MDPIEIPDEIVLKWNSYSFPLSSENIADIKTSPVEELDDMNFIENDDPQKIMITSKILSNPETIHHFLLASVDMEIDIMCAFKYFSQAESNLCIGVVKDFILSDRFLSLPSKVQYYFCDKILSNVKDDIIRMIDIVWESPSSFKKWRENLLEDKSSTYTINFVDRFYCTLMMMEDLE